MLERLKQLLLRLRPEGQEGLETPVDESATFVLRYRELEIGTLRLEGGVWEFTYSEAFRMQGTVQPLIDFPDPEKTYRAQDLWPFFLSRIPGISQPKVQRIIASEGLDAHNEVELLRHFGQRTISNPFELVETAPAA